MKRSVKLRKQMTARAGEAYVVFEILNRGAWADLTRPGREGIDVYGSDADYIRHIGIQVKTKTGTNWQVTRLYGPRTEPDDERNFWVLVDLQDEDHPACYVMPRWWIEDDIWRDHQVYLAKHGGHRPGNDASTHHSISVDRVAQWRDRWDVMGIFTPDV